MGKEGIPTPQSLVKISFYLRVKDSSTINKICCEGCLPQTIFFYFFYYFKRYSCFYLLCEQVCYLYIYMHMHRENI